MPINNPLQNRHGEGRPRPAQPGLPENPLRRHGGAAQRPTAPRRPGRPPLQREEEKTGRRHGKLRSNWFMAIVMVLITLGACFFFAMFILQSASDLFGLNQEDSPIEINVPENATVASIAALLYDKGIVSQPFTFRLYAGMKAEDNEILAGDYVFNKNDSYDQIILSLKEGNTKKEEVTVTFIEGWTLYEIAVKLEENKVCSADEFIAYLDSAEIDYDFVKQIPSNLNRFHKLEGYIFPDTYDFYVGMSPDLVANKFLVNFNNRVTPDMRDKMKQAGLTLDETVTLASIIQKEADNNTENKTVSQVFRNRLKAPETFPQLQSDVTIHYVESFIKPFLNRQDQAMYDAYNTYVCTGLPAGAICNPGLDAINAVLEPDGTGFYYFVTDDAGMYYYATTLQQHMNNVAKAAQTGGENMHGTTTMSGGTQ